MDNWIVKRNLVEAVKFMNAVSTASTLRAYKLEVNKGYKKRNYNQGPYVLVDRFYPMLTRGIFSDHLFEYNCKLIDKYSVRKGKDIKHCIKRTKIALRKEAQALFCIKN